jgi:N-acyl-D-amino-acid deacylase
VIRGETVVDGTGRPAFRADVGVAGDTIDPARAADRATFEQPIAFPEGIHHVFVNGAWTVRAGDHTGARAGRVIRRAS